MSDLYESIEQKRRLTEADLLTGAENLAQMARDGLPAVLSKHEPPQQVLGRLCETVRPRDFRGGGSALWRCAVRLWSEGKFLSLDAALGQVASHERAEAQSALSFARVHGRDTAYHAEEAAARLIALSGFIEVLRETQEIAARTIQESREAFYGVV